MPISTLNCPPSLSYINSFIIDNKSPFKISFWSKDMDTNDYSMQGAYKGRKAKMVHSSYIGRNRENSL